MAASFGYSVLAFQTEQDIEEFKMLGEKAYYKKCTQGEFSDELNKVFKTIGMDIKKICKNNIAELKNLTKASALTDEQESQSITNPITYLTHYDYTNGFSVEYPSDWKAADKIIYKGTREFSVTVFNEPMYSLVDTDGFGSVYFDSYKGMTGVTITEGLSRINIGLNDEPALTFSYSKDYYETTTTLLIHNNVGYAFGYKTLKQNSDADFNTMAHFLASIKFLPVSNNPQSDNSDNPQSDNSEEYPFHPNSINQYFGGKELSSLPSLFNKTK